MGFPLVPNLVQAGFFYAYPDLAEFGIIGAKQGFLIVGPPNNTQAPCSCLPTAVLFFLSVTRSNTC
jgi:hypothetical protein